jgi:DNA adenine methylase
MSYPGGKAGAGVFQTLINLMPPHDCYVEAFLGGAAVMREKRPAAVNIGIDSDRTALEMARSFAPAPRARSGDGDVPRFEFINGDSIEFLRKHPPFPPSTLIYCDPPYLRSTRASSKALYNHEMTDAQHVELLRVLKSLPCRVMISGYSSTLYAKELKGWNATAFQAATRGRPAAEWVWFNYDRPVELHDYRFLGSNFRERANIKRQTARWTARLEKMPALKRQALLAAIAATTGTGVARAAGR